MAREGEDVRDQPRQPLALGHHDAQVARGHGRSVRRMPSGAGHDAQMLARICPAGMIFVPSVGGISHNVKEFTALADIEAGANVLLQTLLQLAN